MEDGTNGRSWPATPVTRRTVLSGVAGVTLGSALATGGAAQSAAAYDELVSSVGLTPRPVAGGGARSLDGTWEFALSASDTPPNGGSSGRVVTPDRSSYVNDGTVYGDPPVVTDPTERAVDLSGDARLTVGEATSLDFDAPGFTLQARVEYGGGSGLVLDRGSSPVSQGTEQFGLGIYDGTVSFLVQSTDGTYPDSVRTDVSAGEWHRIAVVVDGSENRLYVDGELRGAVAHDAEGLASSEAPFVVGGDALDGAVLWLTYDTLTDLGVEWGEEDVPGQWAYDDYFVSSGTSEWYPPDGELGWYRREFTVPDDWSDGSRLLLRFAFGAPGEGITERGSAWASADVRDCLVEYGHITRVDDEARVTFTVADGCELTLSLAVHSMPGEAFDPDTVDEQELLGATTGTFGPGAHTVTVPLPTGGTN